MKDPKELGHPTNNSIILVGDINIVFLFELQNIDKDFLGGTNFWPLFAFGNFSFFREPGAKFFQIKRLMIIQGIFFYYIG